VYDRCGQPFRLRRSQYSVVIEDETMRNGTTSRGKLAQLQLQCMPQETQPNCRKKPHACRQPACRSLSAIARLIENTGCHDTQPILLYSAAKYCMVFDFYLYLCISFLSSCFQQPLIYNFAMLKHRAYIWYLVKNKNLKELLYVKPVKSSH